MLTFVCATASLVRKPQLSQVTPRRVRSSRKCDPCPEDLHTLSIALHSWQKRTRSPRNRLPTDSDLRRCQVAKELSLRTLISRAGGHRNVQSIFNLSPPPTSCQRFQHRELCGMATVLRKMCLRHSLPLPEVSFPKQSVIRELSPSLANRIAAFPGRNGYGRLAEHVKAPLKKKVRGTRSWGVWTEDVILAELARHQSHPRVLPRLCALPTSISAAIQRSGGAALFAARHAMSLEKDLANLVRFARLVAWLSQQVKFDGSDGYVTGVLRQAELAPPFPSAQTIAEAGMTSNLARYGGRRSMATRLGFARENGIKGLFMGPFSVRLAADVLEYSVRHIVVCEDGSVGMPSVSSLRSSGRHELADAVGYFGGKIEVGRRVGLVPDGINKGRPIEILT